MATEIKIPRPLIATIDIKIQSMAGSTMLQNRFTEEAGKKIKGVVTGAATQGRANVKPEEVFKAKQYRTNDGKLGVPGNAIKACMVKASDIAGLKMTHMRKAFFVIGEIIPFSKNSKPVLHETFLNLPKGGRTLVVRPEIKTWELVVSIRFNVNYISKEQVVNLLSLSGFHCGLLDYRPSSRTCSGPHGMFELVPEKKKKKN